MVICLILLIILQKCVRTISLHQNLLYKIDVVTIVKKDPEMKINAHSGCFSKFL